MKCLILELGMALLIILVRYICFVKKKKRLLVLSFGLQGIIYHYTLTLQDWLLPTFEYFSREIGVSDVIPHRSLNSILWKAPNDTEIWGTSLRMSPLSRPMLCRMTHAVLILHALSRLARRPVWSALNLFSSVHHKSVHLKQRDEDKIRYVDFSRLSKVMGLGTCLVRNELN